MDSFIVINLQFPQKNNHNSWGIVVNNKKKKWIPEGLPNVEDNEDWSVGKIKIIGMPKGSPCDEELVPENWAPKEPLWLLDGSQCYYMTIKVKKIEPKFLSSNFAQPNIGA